MGSGGSTKEELEESLGRSLPPYMIPRRWMMLEEWPLSANGKIDRRALPEIEEESENVEVDAEGPRNETERTICEVWTEVLGREVDDINRSFFDFGGDSIAAIRITVRLGQSVGREVRASDVLRNPTVRGFADRLRVHEVTDERSPERRVNRTFGSIRRPFFP